MKIVSVTSALTQNRNDVRNERRVHRIVAIGVTTRDWKPRDRIYVEFI